MGCIVNLEENQNIIQKKQEEWSNRNETQFNSPNFKGLHLWTNSKNFTYNLTAHQLEMAEEEKDLSVLVMT